MARGRFLAPGEVIITGVEVIGELNNPCTTGQKEHWHYESAPTSGSRVAVADPDALAAYYGEMGLTGDATSGYTGSDGGAVVVLDEAPVRRLVSVDLGCADGGDLDDVRRRLEVVARHRPATGTGSQPSTHPHRWCSRSTWHHPKWMALRARWSHPTPRERHLVSTLAPGRCSTGPDRRAGSATW